MKIVIALVCLVLLPVSAWAQEEVTVTRIYSPPVTDLTILPGADLILGPVGRDVLPSTGYTVNLGRLTRKYLTLHAAELWVETLVAQNTIATIGGRIVVAPTNALTRDLLASDVSGVYPTQATNNFCVKYNLFKLHVVGVELGSKIIMQSDGKFEAFTVFNTAVPTVTGSGDYCYTVYRNQDNSGLNDWYAGDAAVDTGKFTTGPDGFIDLFSLSGLASGTQVGPSIVGNVRTGIDFSDWEPRWAIGNLDGVYGYGPTYGAAFGVPGGARLTAEATNGIVIYGSDNDPKVIIDASGNATFDGKLTVGTGRNILRNSECRVGTEDWLGATNTGLTQTVLGPSFNPWRLNGEPNTCYYSIAGTPVAGTLSQVYTDGQRFPVTANIRYEASVYVGTHLAAGTYVVIQWLNSSAGLISENAGNSCGPAFVGGNDIASFCRTGVIAAAPSGAVAAMMRIETLHTAQADPFVFWVRSFFGEASITQEDLTEWGPAGITEITNGLIRTDAIDARAISADSITASELSANSITAADIAAGTITATQIASNTITADRLSVSSLDAISANLGTINAGTITGVTISGSTVNAGSGNEVVLNNSGMTINNGTGTNNRIKWGSNIFMYGASSGLLWLDANEIFLAVSGGGTPNVTVSGGTFQAQNGATFYNAVHHIAFQGSGSNRFVCHDNNGLLYSSGSACNATEEASTVADLQAQITELRAEIAALKAERRQ